MSNFPYQFSKISNFRNKTENGVGVF